MLIIVHHDMHHTTQAEEQRVVTLLEAKCLSLEKQLLAERSVAASSSATGVSTTVLATETFLPRGSNDASSTNCVDGDIQGIGKGADGNQGGGAHEVDDVFNKTGGGEVGTVNTNGGAGVGHTPSAPTRHAAGTEIVIAGNRYHISKRDHFHIAKSVNVCFL